MKRQLNLKLFDEENTIDLSLDKIIGSKHTPTTYNFPKLHTDAALSLAELSSAIDNWCEAILHSDEDILLASSTDDFISKYAIDTLTSIDDLLARYSTNSYMSPAPQSEEDTKIDFSELLKGF